MSLLLRRRRKAKVVQHEPPKPAEKETFPKHTGGGWYELSNGDKVQGTVEAKEQQKSVGE